MGRRVLLAAVTCLMVGAGAEALAQSVQLRETAAMINGTIRANYFRPAELDSDAYRQIEEDVIALAETATSADEFMNGFNAIWRKGPFSHVGLQKAQESAADRYMRLDTLLAGDDAVTLAWQDSTAILTVNTMSGTDTIENFRCDATLQLCIGAPSG